jgi:hypothetical protein
MSTEYPMTKSPRAVAREALALAREALPAYSSKYSRKGIRSRRCAARRECRASAPLQFSKGAVRRVLVARFIYRAAVI